MIEVTVSVTPADIKNGKLKVVTSCPVALAASRVKLEGTTFASAAHMNLWWMDAEDNVLFRGTLPDEARDWITAFDNKRAVEPITFTLEVTSYAEIAL